MKLFYFLLLISNLAFAQTTILICEDNFDNPNLVGCSISKANLQINRVTSDINFSNFIRQNGLLEFSTSIYYPSTLGFELNNFSDLNQYDSIKIEMTFDPGANFQFDGSKFFARAQQTLISLNYGSLSGQLIGVPPVIFDYIEFYSNKLNYNLNTKKLTLSFSNITGKNLTFATIRPDDIFSSFSRFNSNWGAGEFNCNNYNVINRDPKGDLTFISNIKKSFCANKPNPTDCESNVIISVISNPVSMQVKIDNFKAYGIKNTVTGFESKERGKNEKKLISTYNLLGEQVTSTFKGMVINVYSDGSKTKEVREY